MELQAKKREVFGNKVKALRREGLIPAELYGHGFENVHLSVVAKEFSKVFKEAGEHTVITVKANDKEYPAVIHSVDINPISGHVRHVDFHKVKMDEVITASVPITFTGESPAVKEKTGVLIKAIQEIEVEALPGDLPHEIEINLDTLNEVGKSIPISNVKVSDKVKILLDPETVIATITEIPEEEVVVEEVSVEDVKVEGEEEITERRKEKGEVNEQLKEEAKKEEEKKEPKEGKNK